MALLAAYWAYSPTSFASRFYPSFDASPVVAGRSAFPVLYQKPASLSVGFSAVASNLNWNFYAIEGPVVS